jgi:hypothetical protein
MMARVIRNRSGQEAQRDVYVATPPDPDARPPWSGGFWAPIGERFETGEEIFLNLQDGRAGHAIVYRIELDVRIRTNCRVELTGTSLLG